MADVKGPDRDMEIAERLMAMLDSKEAQSKSVRQRRARMAYFRRIDLVLVAQPGEPQVAGYARNVSTGGLGLLCRRSFKVDERFVTLLEFGGGLGKWVLCRTRFCQYVADCMYETGAEMEATKPRLRATSKYPAEWVEVARGRATLRTV